MKAGRFKSWQAVLLIALVISLINRFYQLRHQLYFQLDEERDLFLARRIIYYHDIPLIGQHVPGGLFLGPLYIWMTSIVAWIMNFNPFWLGAIASFLGVIATYVIYLVGKQLFSRQIGLIASLIWSTSFLISFFNRIWWPLVFSPLIALISYYSLYKINQKQYQYFIVLTVALIVGIQSDPASVSILITSYLLLILWKVPKKFIIQSVIAIILSHLPLVAFEIKHKFQITKNFATFFKFSGNHEVNYLQTILDVLKSFLSVITDLIWPATYSDKSQIISWCKEYALFHRQQTPLIILLLAGLMLLFIIKTGKRHPLGRQILISHIMVSLVGIILYQLLFPGYLNNWFYSILFPALILLFSLSVYAVWTNLKSLAPLFIVAILIINLIPSLMIKNSLSLGYKSDAVNFVLENIEPNNRLRIDSLGRCFAWSGYRLLFVQKGIIPASSYLDSLFGDWLYPSEINTQTADKVVTFFDHEQLPWNEFTITSYQQLKRDSLINRRFGGIEVFVSTPQ